MQTHSILRSQTQVSRITPPPPPPAEPPEQPSDPQIDLSMSPRRRASSCSNSSDSPLLELMSAGPSKSLIDRLISPGGQVRYDRSSGRLRPVYPIVALHQLADLPPGFATGISRDKDRRADRLVRELNPETHDYLMDCFWSYYDPVMQVVCRKLFEEDRRSGGGLAYSGFLHICILAMGYRYADPKRADIQKLTLRDKQSTLHREAKYLVEFEFEEPGGIPSVQALLILAQLESGSGRDGVGWIYAGIDIIHSCAVAEEDIGFTEADDLQESRSDTPLTWGLILTAVL
ncbi:hypothetical protein LTS10_000257 [Elasticomyces elasticus]|nr:hypothetical protein LTS10_000257 [Elasticomyces elasticus]